MAAGMAVLVAVLVTRTAAEQEASAASVSEMQAGPALKHTVTFFRSVKSNTKASTATAAKSKEGVPHKSKQTRGATQKAKGAVKPAGPSAKSGGTTGKHGCPCGITPSCKAEFTKTDIKDLSNDDGISACGWVCRRKSTSPCAKNMKKPCELMVAKFKAFTRRDMRDKEARNNMIDNLRKKYMDHYQKARADHSHKVMLQNAGKAGGVGEGMDVGHMVRDAQKLKVEDAMNEHGGCSSSSADQKQKEKDKKDAIQRLVKLRQLQGYVFLTEEPAGRFKLPTKHASVFSDSKWYKKLEDMLNERIKKSKHKCIKKVKLGWSHPLKRYYAGGGRQAKEGQFKQNQKSLRELAQLDRKEDCRGGPCRLQESVRSPRNMIPKIGEAT